MIHYVRFNESCEFTRRLENQQLLYYAFPRPRVGCFPRSSYRSKWKDLGWVSVCECVYVGKLKLVIMKNVWAMFISFFNWKMSLGFTGNEVRGWKYPGSLLLSKPTSRQSFSWEPGSCCKVCLATHFLDEGSQSRGKWMEVWLTTGHNGYISFLCKWEIVLHIHKECLSSSAGAAKASELCWISKCMWGLPMGGSGEFFHSQRIQIAQSLLIKVVTHRKKLYNLFFPYIFKDKADTHCIGWI